MMAIYGANVGSTLARMALSSTLKGAVRQLTACQDLFKIAGAVVFVPLLYVEVFAHVPLVYALARHLSTRVDRQMAFVFLLFNLSMAILFTGVLPFICRLLEWATPADGQEDHSKVQYLYCDSGPGSAAAGDERVRAGHLDDSPLRAAD
jgi:phosphate:Na+ symporter